MNKEVREIINIRRKSVILEYARLICNAREACREFDVSVINALVLCYFVKFGISLKEMFQMIDPCTEFNYKNPQELETVGERIMTIARLFNNREGFNKKDDILPDRELKEALPAGPAKGETVNLDPLRSEYYQLMG